MPDTTKTKLTQDIPGDVPDSMIFSTLYAALTPHERTQVMLFMDSLLQRNSA